MSHSFCVFFLILLRYKRRISKTLGTFYASSFAAPLRWSWDRKGKSRMRCQSEKTEKMKFGKAKNRQTIQRKQSSVKTNSKHQQLPLNETNARSKQNETDGGIDRVRKKRSEFLKQNTNCCWNNKNGCWKERVLSSFELERSSEVHKGVQGT